MNKLFWTLLLMVMPLAFAAQSCRVQKIVWDGEHTEYDEQQMNSLLGEPCQSWQVAADKLVRYYEDRGFAAAKIFVSEQEGTLMVKLDRGPGYVWAAPENLVPSGTRPEVFKKLTGIEEGAPVSISDLVRSERRLSRLGYFEQSAPTKLFRDGARNRLVPAFSMAKANVSQAEGLLTYSSEDNSWNGQIDVSLFNIAGTARDLRLEGFTGENIRHLYLAYKEPWILGSNWNVVLRGRFDEEKYEDVDVAGGSDEGDALDRVVMGEIGVTRDVGFDFTFGVYFGISENDKHSSLEMTYASLDRFALPRRGWKLDGQALWKIDRPDSLDNMLQARVQVVSYYTLHGNVIGRFGGGAGGVFPTESETLRSDLYTLGGLDNFKGIALGYLRSRAYGFSEFALMWQDGYDLSIELFYQPGLYRRMEPGHGWAREQDYGLGFTQYRKNWSINLYYALRNGCDYLEGVLGFGVKTLF